jgi:FAD binding domain/Berberine and berberine like
LANNRFDRRQFLRGSAGLLIGLGVASQSPSIVRARWIDGSVSPAPWSDLAGELQGTLLLPVDFGFSDAAEAWNLRFSEIRPAAIALCASAADVATCLLWAQANGVATVARSGGHSYAGYSNTTGLMIKLSGMNQVDYDSGTGMVRLGGGARNADVYSSLRGVGRAVTHGRCEAVGVAGLVLGGGIGFNMRRKGLTCDHLVATDLVTTDGRTLHCSDQENAGLFWACKGGGGGNFGINTSFTFQTFPASDVTVYNITWSSNLESLLPALLNLLPQTTDRLGCKLSVINDGSSLSIELLGQIVGSQSELRSILAPIYALVAPSQEAIMATDYWDGQDFLSEEGTPEYTHERSRYIYHPVPADGSRTILDFLRHWPGTGASATWKIFLMGGAVDAVARDATAYVHRGASMISSIELDWIETDTVATVAKNQTWLAEFHEAMRPYTSEESYQNFIDEAQNDYLRAYYGDNLGQLVQVKRKYDPLNVLTYQQAIPLAYGPAGA